MMEKLTVEINREQNPDFNISYISDDGEWHYCKSCEKTTDLLIRNIIKDIKAFSEEILEEEE